MSAGRVIRSSKLVCPRWPSDLQYAQLQQGQRSRGGQCSCKEDALTNTFVDLNPAELETSAVMTGHPGVPRDTSPCRTLVTALFVWLRNKPSQRNAVQINTPITHFQCDVRCQTPKSDWGPAAVAYISVIRDPSCRPYHSCLTMWAAVSALSLAVQLALCVFNFFSFILFLSKLNDDDDDDSWLPVCFFTAR